MHKKAINHIIGNYGLIIENLSEDKCIVFQLKGSFKMFMWVYSIHQIKNGKGENVDDTTTRPNRRQSLKVTIWSSTQQENPSPR